MWAVREVSHVRRASRDAGGNGGTGSKWIRPEKRLRIYARDGFRCVWCECRVVGGREFARRQHVALACLDHVLPRDRGGSNAAGNLLTSCVPCNAERGTRSAVMFAYTRPWPASTLDRVIESMARGLPPRKAQK